MEIRVLGAAGEVTASCHLVRIGGRQVLLDCGLIQGSPRDEARNREPFAFDPAAIDAVVLSHAHIDHSGRIPLLVKQGYRGPVYCHEACRELCRSMLRDAGFLNEKEAEWANRKRERKGLALVEPLYTVQDAGQALRQFRPLGYGEMQAILPGVTLRLADAGHILGSAIIELWLAEKGVERKIVFSGDLGHRGMPLLREFTAINEADLVIMESTYGDRIHRPWEDTWQEMKAVLSAARQKKGNILFPAFAVDRSQELIYVLGQHLDTWGLEHWQVFLDSPMAIEATEVYLRHSTLFKPEAAEYFRRHRHHPLLPNLHFTRTAIQSMKLNQIRSGAIIIAGSGMCTGGRIRHHLKHNVWRRDCHVIIVGFQAQGTIGRALVDGAKHIRLWGETIQVKAHVHTIGGLSAHADQDGLMTWYGHFRHRPPVILVHGEQRALAALAERMRSALHAPVQVARRGESVDLAGLRHWS